MPTKLKLCLYCGSTESIPAKHETQHAVMCLVCKARGPNKPTEQEAIAAWNKRFVCLDMNENPVYAGDKVKYKLPNWKNKFMECYVAELHPPFCGLTADNDFDFEDGSFFPSEIELIKEAK